MIRRPGLMCHLAAWAARRAPRPSPAVILAHQPMLPCATCRFTWRSRLPDLAVALTMYVGGQYVPDRRLWPVGQAHLAAPSWRFCRGEDCVDKPRTVLGASASRRHAIRASVDREAVRLMASSSVGQMAVRLQGSRLLVQQSRSISAARPCLSRSLSNSSPGWFFVLTPLTARGSVRPRAMLPP